MTARELAEISRHPYVEPATATSAAADTYHDWARRGHPQDLPRAEAELRRCKSKHLPYETEYRVVWPDKSVHWIASRGVFQHDAQGKAQRMLGIIMDITPRKRLKLELLDITERER